MAINNNINKDSQLVLLSAKRNPTNHKALHIPWSWETIPTSRISLTSTLCTQGLFTPVVGNAWGLPLCEGFFWWAQTDPCSLSLDAYFISLFNIPHSDFGNVIMYFLWTLDVWNGLSIVTYSHYWILGKKCRSFRFSLGVCPMDTARCSFLSGCLVSGGRWAPP
jgi:hypothetical protein